MDARGRFEVSDDPGNVIATAVSLALAPPHRDLWKTALAPDGEGLHIQGFGDVRRALDRDDLPAPFQDDPTLDPERVELWRILRERTSDLGVGWGVIRGDELRDLVVRGEALRRAGGW